MELKEYYQIVPTDDGTTFLCYDKVKNKMFNVHKGDPKNPHTLVFKSKENADKWIEEYKLGNKYKSEPFWSVLDYQTED